MSYIEEYYNYLLKYPKRAPLKVLTVYKKLVNDIKKPRKVSFFNKLTKENETHTYIFDEELGLRAITFIEKYCKQSKGRWAGKPLILELWEKAFVEALFGFVDKDTRLRKYRKGILFVARKNGKSELAAAIATYLLTKDGEGGAEIYSVAAKKDQAKIVWEEAKKMINKSMALKKRIRTLVNGLFYDKTDSFFKPVSSDSNSLDGLNAHGVIADEVHAWKDKNLMDVMYDSMGARVQPLLLETSTMGIVRESVFDNEYNYASQVIFDKVSDETLLAIIYEADKLEEWQDEECWYKPNPGLGTIKSISTLRSKVERANNNPTELTNLLCKDFNIRQVDTRSWLTFDELNNESEYKEFKDCYCLGGCDLSSTTDLTCATLMGYQNGELKVKQMYFLPSKNFNLKIDEDKIPYDIWQKKGWLRVSEGSKVNYSDVTNWFVEQVEQFNLRPLWVGYDSWNAQYWCDEMKEYGFDMLEVRQGAKTMSQPMKQLKADLIDKKINYNNNPILKWCLSNMSIKQDENENIRPVKEKSRQRIDGAVSLIDAYCIYVEKQQEYLNFIGGE